MSQLYRTTWREPGRLAALFLLVALLGACGVPSTTNMPALPSAAPEPTMPPLPATSSLAPQQEPAIVAAVETDQVPNSGDAADDPAIWVDTRNPARSLVIGTDKKGGLAIYDLAGKQLDYLPDGKMNNVDVREGFSLGGQSITLVTASDRSRDIIAIYRLNSDTRRLENVAARSIATIAAYGACMYHSRSTGMFYYIVNSEQGEVEQWRLFDNGAGKIDATRVRAFDIGSQTEGCVADDLLGHLYIGEEDVGVWKYGAEPTAGEMRTSVDTTSGSQLVKDVEGITIYDAGGGAGYLIVSSQGNNSYVVYRREGDNAYLATFEIVNANGVDGVSQTDGIDVTSANLGPAFPQGMLVVQDGKNDGCNQNFKYVSWELIAQVTGLQQARAQAQPVLHGVARPALSGASGQPSQNDGLNQSFLPVVWGKGC